MAQKWWTHSQLTKLSINTVLEREWMLEIWSFSCQKWVDERTTGYV